MDAIKEMTPPRPRPNAATQYQYQSLRCADEFRCLILKSGAADSDLSCEVITVTLSSAPSFEAISYAWGNGQPDQPLLCNGQALLITPRLIQELRHLRRDDRQRRLWIDQICINQQDDREKGHQVQLMADIYKQADRVIACLGDTSETGRHIESLLAEVITGFEEEARHYGAWYKIPTPYRKFNNLLNDTRYKSFQRVCLDPYWTRLWIIQELGVSKRSDIFIGDTIVSWSDFLETHEYLCGHDGLSQATAIGFPHYGTLTGWSRSSKRHWFMSDSLNTNQSTRFLQLLEECRGQRTSDVRDRIFALLGHPSAPDKRIVKPDYTKNAKTVFHDFTTRWITQGFGLAILSAVQPRGRTDMYDGSWVPHWIDTIRLPFGLQDGQCFTAGTAMESGNPYTLINNGILHVRGVVLDEVSKLWRFGRQSRSSVNAKEISDAATELQDMEVCSLYVERGMSNLTAFIRSVACEPAGYESVAEALDRIEAAVQSNPSITHPYTSVDFWKLDQAGGDRWLILDRIETYNRGRKYACTSKYHLLGLVPDTTQPGDMCAIVSGCPVPLILRRGENGPGYAIVGEAYLYGLMEGQIRRWIDSGKCAVQQIALCGLGHRVSARQTIASRSRTLVSVGHHAMRSPATTIQKVTNKL
jgi:hypothetical protein